MLDIVTPLKMNNLAIFIWNHKPVLTMYSKKSYTYQPNFYCLKTLNNNISDILEPS